MKKQAHLSPSLSVPRLIIGLWQIADMEKERQLNPLETAAFMNKYVDAGFTAFDMADHYGSSEIIAGVCKNNHPNSSSINLFTKWVPKPGSIDKNEVRKAVQTALDRMQQTSLDMMQFHAWHYPDPSWLDALIFLKELKEEGLIRHIGVTNFDAHHLRIALGHGIPIVSNQISHSVIDRRALGAMKEVCEQYNVKLLAYGTLAGGFLSDRWLGRYEPAMKELQTWSQMKYKRFIDVTGGWQKFQNILKVLDHIAQKHQTSLANIASRFVLENPNVAAVIVGARLGENAHIEDHQKLLELELDESEVNSIEEAIAQLTPVPGNCGDEYRKPPFLTASGDLSHHLDKIPGVYQPVSMSEQREQVYSGTVWEGFAGYSRAVKKGNRILVSGTTATHGNLLVGGHDAGAQAHFVIDKIEAAIESLGGSLKDVVRTRVFVNDMNDWEAVARAHGHRFRDIDPANTLVQAQLVGEGYLVEIEAEAMLDS